MKRQKTALFTRLRKTVDSLIDAPQIADIQRRRQARLLAALLLIILPLGGLSGSVQLLTVPGFLLLFWRSWGRFSSWGLPTCLPARNTI